MKKIGIILTLLLLAGVVSVQAQSGGASKGQQGTLSTTNDQKANASQMQGKGVPYTKDKEQQGRSTPKKNNKPIPPSEVGTESDLPARATGEISPGSHAAQRDRKAGVNAMKPRSRSNEKQ